MTDSLTEEKRDARPRVTHDKLRNAEVTVLDRQVRFDHAGLSEPLDGDLFDVLVTIPGYDPERCFCDNTSALPIEGECPFTNEEPDYLPQFPEATLDEQGWEMEYEGDGWFDVWRAMDLNSRIDFAAGEEFTVDQLLSFQDYEARTRNSKKVITVLNDLIVRRTPQRSAEAVNLALMEAMVPREVEE